MKTLVISGGSSGIGLACVNKFLVNGYFVYNLDITENNENKFKNNYKWINTNVTEHSAIKYAVSTIVECVNIDSLIISAGKHLSANIEQTDDNQLNELLDLNVKGAFWLIKEVIECMKTVKKGAIVTIGSDQSSVAKYNSTVYGMTKSALLSLTKSIALDYAKYNIRANCIGAGTIDTPLYRKAITKYAEKSGIPLDQIENDEALEQPFGRIGYSEEVAELAYFLCQDVVAYMTGALLPIDGGYIAK